MEWPFFLGVALFFHGAVFFPVRWFFSHAVAVWWPFSGGKGFLHRVGGFTLWFSRARRFCWCFIQRFKWHLGRWFCWHFRWHFFGFGSFGKFFHVILLGLRVTLSSNWKSGISVDFPAIDFMRKTGIIAQCIFRDTMLAKIELSFLQHIGVNFLWPENVSTSRFW